MMFHDEAVVRTGHPDASFAPPRMDLRDPPAGSHSGQQPPSGV